MAEANTYALFPNIDDLTEKERSMFMKAHEFEKAMNTMIAELDALLNNSAGSSSEILSAQNNITIALQDLVSKIESDFNDLIKRYISQLAEETAQVEAAFERLYSKIHQVIQSINVNIQNRTITYDTIMSYKLKIENEIYKLYGRTSPYQDGRRDTDDRYVLSEANKTVQLRDIDEGQGYLTYPVVIDPNIAQDKIIKLFDFTPIRYDEDIIPSFLAEVIISGDLFNFKGILTSAPKDSNGGRTAIFKADYLINQDLPYGFKVLYDKTNNKIALAFKYDDTSDKFTSIVKFDVSVNLLVGKDLSFSNENTIMDNVNLNTYEITIDLENLEEYVESVKTVTSGGSFSTQLAVKGSALSDYELPKDKTDKDFFSFKINGEEISRDYVSYDNSSGTLTVSNITGNLYISVKASHK